MANPKQKFYAVRNGLVPGIYLTWADCKRQVDGYANAVYKSFATRAEAEQFLHGRAPAYTRKSQTAAQPDASVVSDPNAVIVYTDGSCLKNPGRGGYGVVILDGDQRRELARGFILTTNNRMEILACIAALQALKARERIVLHTDSQYVVNSISKGWAKGWRRNGWQRPTGPVVNADLWQVLLELCEQHDVTFQWVRGHAGNVENERCDLLARAAAQGNDLEVDAGYLG